MNKKVVVAGAVISAVTLVLLWITLSQPSSPTSSPASPSPTASAPPAQRLDDALGALAGQMPVQVQFEGADAGGGVSFNVVTDGRGDLAGAYTRQGNTADVVVYGHNLYIHGGHVLQSYTGVPADPGLTGWVEVPATYGSGLLGTVADSRLLTSCLRHVADTAPGWRSAGTQLIDGSQAAALAPAMSGAVPWLFALRDGRPSIAAVDVVVFTPLDMPVDCTGGTSAAGTPGAVPEGELVIRAVPRGMAPPSSPPRPVVPMPTLDVIPDPGLPGPATSATPAPS